MGDNIETPNKGQQVSKETADWLRKQAIKAKRSGIEISPHVVEQAIGGGLAKSPSKTAGPGEVGE